MKTIQLNKKAVFILLTVLLGSLSSIRVLAADENKNSEQLLNDTTQYNVFYGSVEDDETGDPLLFVTVGIKGSNIATVTNTDGNFVIKVPKSSSANMVTLSHIGYNSTEVGLRTFKGKRNVIKMTMATIPLDAVNVYPRDARQLVRNMMFNVNENYPLEPMMMKGFYRETIKKNKSHVGIAEAVVDIYKAGYNTMRNDQVKIYKGRKTEDTNKLDTLVFRLKGGPATALLMDVIKQPYSLLAPEDFQNYTYSVENIIQIDGKPHFIVGFKQNPGAEFPLYNGRFYIEANTLALTSIEFSFNLEDEVAATKLLIQKKPMGLKVTTKHVTYKVNYREQGGKWYFNYARAEMEFRFNWKKKLFNTNYSAMLEIAITDRSEDNVVRFKGSERFKDSHIFSEKVASFGDPDFWGAHNTIVPDESIQSAINKLSRKGRF